MLYRETNRVDRENLMQLFVHSVDNRRSLYTLKHVVHTISYDGGFILLKLYLTLTPFISVG